MLQLDISSFENRVDPVFVQEKGLIRAQQIRVKPAELSYLLLVAEQ